MFFIKSSLYISYLYAVIQKSFFVVLHESIGDLLQVTCFFMPYSLSELCCTNKPHTNRELSTKQSISGIEQQMYVPLSCPFIKNVSVTVHVINSWL